jgi:hypothetical protein
MRTRYSSERLLAAEWLWGGNGHLYRAGRQLLRQPSDASVLQNEWQCVVPEGAARADQRQQGMRRPRVRDAVYDVGVTVNPRQFELDGLARFGR